MQYAVLTAINSQANGARVSGLTPALVYAKLLADNYDVSGDVTLSEIGNGDYKIAYDAVVNGDASIQVDLDSAGGGGATLTLAGDRFVTRTITVEQANAVSIGGMDATGLVQSAGYLVSGITNPAEANGLYIQTQFTFPLLFTNTDGWQILAAPGNLAINLTPGSLLGFFSSVLEPTTAAWTPINGATGTPVCTAVPVRLIADNRDGNKTAADADVQTVLGNQTSQGTGTLATPTNITAGTITTVTNLTNAPTSGDLTATMKASVTAAVPTVGANQAGLATKTQLPPALAGSVSASPAPTQTAWAASVGLVAGQQGTITTGACSGQTFTVTSVAGGVNTVSGLSTAPANGDTFTASQVATAGWLFGLWSWLSGIATALIETVSGVERFKAAALTQAPTPAVSLGANAPPGWINAAAFASGVLPPNLGSLILTAGQGIATPDDVEITIRPAISASTTVQKSTTTVEKRG